MMSRQKHPFSFRVLCCVVLVAAVNLMVGGPGVAVAYAKQRNIQQENLRKLRNLGIRASLSDEEIRTRVTDARDRIQKNRKSYRDAEAAGIADSQRIGVETQKAWYDELLQGISARSSEFRNLIANLRDGQDLPLADVAARLRLYRNDLRRTHALLTDSRVRQAALGDHAPTALETAIADRAEAMLSALEPLPEDTSLATRAQVSQVVSRVVETLSDFRDSQRPNRPNGGSRHALDTGYDPVRGRMTRPPNSLPKLKKAEPREPRSSEEQFLMFGDEAILPIVRNGDGRGDPAAKLQSPPTVTDLEETPDTHITPAIQALADALDNDPLDIFNYVVNNFIYDPYYGSRDGAAGALSHGYGNDMDLSSLLIALLRASDIPSRYEYGTVEVPVDTMLGILGVDDSSTASTLLASNGIPTTLVYSGTDPVVFRLERAWVRAYVPYTNYRGLEGISGEGGEGQWVTLDPAFKKQSVKNRVDVRGLADFDIDGYIDLSPDVSPMDMYADDLRDALRAQGLSCPTLEDGRFILTIEPNVYEVLPVVLPYEVVSTPTTAAALPSNLRYQMNVETTDYYGWEDLSASFNLPEIFGKRLALTFPSSASALDSRLSGNVVPVLSLDDVAQASGSSTPAGSDVSVYITVSRPGSSSYMRSHDMIAGGTYVINFENGYINPERIAAVETEIKQLEDAGASQASIDRRIGQLAGLRYAQMMYTDDRLFFDLNGYYYWPQYECLSGAEASPVSYWGMVTGAKADGYMVDAEEELFGAPYNGPLAMSDLSKLISTAGWTGSYWEHAVWGQVVTMAGLSTTNVLQLSRAEGQEIYFLKSYDDYQAIRSQLSHESTVIADVENTLLSGGQVIIHAHTLNYQGRVISGYVLSDPSTGAGKYLINSQMGGGITTVQDFVLGLFAGAANCIVTVLSDVEAHMGDLILTYDDLKHNSVGPKLDIRRVYNSLDTDATAMGYGWSWSFSDRLLFDTSTGDITYVNAKGERLAYTSNGDGTYEPSAGEFMTLEEDGGGYRLEDIDGTVHNFDASGKLLSVEDEYSNRIELQYSSSGDLETILNSKGQAAFLVSTEDGLITRIESPDGRAYQYSYQNGRLKTATDPESRTWTYTYYENGVLGAVQGPDGKSNYYYFDANGRLAQYEDEAGRTGFLAYDDVNRRTTHTTLDGATTILLFDSFGQCVGSISPSGTKEERTYSDGQVTEYTDSRGATTAYDYNSDGQVTEITNPDGTVRTQTYEPGTGRLTSVSIDGAETTYSYDDNAGTRTVTSSDGKTTQYTLTDTGQIGRIQREDGSQVDVTFDPDTGGIANVNELDSEGQTRATQLQYDGSGRISSFAIGDVDPMTLVYDDTDNMVSMADDKGAKFLADYDGRGNMTVLADGDGNTLKTMAYEYEMLVSDTDAEGRTKTFDYDDRGRAIKVTNPLGNSREIEYDLLGRVSRRTDYRGNATELGWCADLSQEPCDIIDPVGNLVQREFDENGFVTSETTPLGTQTWTRGSDGRILTFTDRMGNVTRYTYNNVGQVTSVIDPLEHTTEYEYDARGNLTQRVDAEGNETAFAYNDLGQLTSLTDAEGRITTFTYAPNGQRATTLYPDGATLSREFSPLNLITAETFKKSGGQTTFSRSFVYNNKGLLTQVAAGDSQLDFAHDSPVGDVTAITDNLTGKSMAITYDPVTGYRASLERPDGTQELRYDQYGNLASIVAPDGGVFRYQYDKYNRLTRQTYPNGTTEERFYDEYGRLSGVVHSTGAGVIFAGESYTYDALDRLISASDEEGATTTYTYDAAGQLTGISGPYENKTYEYDAVGNRVRTYEDSSLIEQCTYNALNQAESCDREGTATTYAYDLRGNRVEENKGGIKTTYTYDEANQLVSATGSWGTTTYQYDALGRRISKSDSSGTRYYVYDDIHLIMELDENFDPVRTFVRGPGLDRLLAFTDFTHESPETGYFHQDGRSNIVALSNSSGSRSARYHFGATGALLSQSGNVSNEWLFAGRSLDTNLNKYNFRARIYDPETGGFLQSDPLNAASIGEQRTGLAAMISATNRLSLQGHLKDPLSQNPYAYARNAPTRFWDPSGEGAFDLVAKLVAAYAFALVTVLYNIAYFPVTWANLLLGEAYNTALGPSVMGALADPCSLLDLPGLLIGYTWSNALSTILKPMRADLFPNPSGNQVKIACFWKAQAWANATSNKAQSSVPGPDPGCVPMGILFWVIIGYMTYFLLLEYVMIYLFMMPGISISVPAECSCYNWP